MSDLRAVTEKRLLREAQILELIPVSKATFRRWVHKRYFPKGIKMIGRITVWRAETVYQFIERLGADPQVETPPEKDVARGRSTNSIGEDDERTP